jgi:hypothetical protein
MNRIARLNISNYVTDNFTSVRGGINTWEAADIGLLGNRILQDEQAISTRPKLLFVLNSLWESGYNMHHLL